MNGRGWAGMVAALGLAALAGAAQAQEPRFDGQTLRVATFGGGWDKARILEIMKDSRVGSYGVVAKVLASKGESLTVDQPIVEFV